MPRPLSSLALRWLLVPCAVAFSVLGAINEPLKTEAAPNGIVSLQVCGLNGSCRAILQSWGAAQREQAMLSLGFDYLFLVLYPTVIAAALFLLARRLRALVAGATAMLAWLVIAAGAADAVENYLLVQVLRTGEASVYALPASLLAVAKFGVLGVALAWLFIGTTLVWRRKGDA